MINLPGRHLLPVSVQGELVEANHLFVLALIATVKKYGHDGVLEITQMEAVELIGNTKSVDISFDFSMDSLQLRVR